MKKVVLFILIVINTISPCCAQSGQWAWIHGDTISDQNNVYGVMGVADTLNKPCSKFGTSYWIDKSGNFWLTGGSAIGFAPSNPKSAMWKYDPNTNMWTWVSGNTPPFAFNYGTQGVESASNEPGQRTYACNWVDNNNNLWLFGGVIGNNTGFKNDLWKYNIATKQWTWMKGGQGTYQNGKYGIKGISNTTNDPGGRRMAVSWVDKNGDFWLFGGEGYDANFNYGMLNDFWKYSPSTNEWTWMGGTDVLPSSFYNDPQNGVYGTKGVPDVNNIPSGRNSSVTWADNNNNLWLFGGGTSLLSKGKNDLWRYKIATGEWTWLNGDSAYNDNGNYPSYCASANTYSPGARFYNNASWVDDCDNLWLFGGTQDNVLADYNDIWKYDTGTNEWTWMNGSNKISSYAVKPIYGQKGQSTSITDPGSRANAAGWRAKDGSFYVFGGFVKSFAVFGGGYNSGYITRNDMWKYTPEKTIAEFVPGIAGICGDITFTGTNIPGCNKIKTYLWNFDDPFSDTSNTSTSANPTHQFSDTGTYNVTLAIINCAGVIDYIIHPVTINSPQLISLAVTKTPTSCNSGNDGSATVIVSGGTPPFTYSWSTTPVQSSSMATNLTAGVYHILVSDINCSSKTTTTVSEPLPLTVTTSPVAICNYDSIVLSANPTGGNGSYSYSWTPGNMTNQNPIVSPSSTTEYSIAINDSNGCTASVKTLLVKVNPLPVITITPDTNISKGSSILLTAGGGTIFLWTPASTVNCDDCSNTLATPLTTTTYYVSVKDANGCINADSVTVIVSKDETLFLPNTFTPNGDGINDIFYVYGTQIKTIQFNIYNRWGEKLFSSNSLQNGWDGGNKSIESENNVFVCVAKCVFNSGNEASLTGEVVLIK